jgi:hypothetical protein
MEFSKALNFMKIKMHYITGKKQQVACGKQNVLVTTNFREITCKRCLKTHSHRKVKGNARTSVVVDSDGDFCAISV